MGVASFAEKVTDWTCGLFVLITNSRVTINSSGSVTDSFCVAPCWLLERMHLNALQRWLSYGHVFLCYDVRGDNLAFLASRPNPCTKKTWQRPQTWRASVSKRSLVRSQSSISSGGLLTFSKDVENRTKLSELPLDANEIMTSSNTNWLRLFGLMNENYNKSVRLISEFRSLYFMKRL